MTVSSHRISLEICLILFRDLLWGPGHLRSLALLYPGLSRGEMGRKHPRYRRPQPYMLCHSAGRARQDPEKYTATEWFSSLGIISDLRMILEGFTAAALT